MAQTIELEPWWVAGGRARHDLRAECVAVESESVSGSAIRTRHESATAKNGDVRTHEGLSSSQVLRLLRYLSERVGIRFVHTSYGRGGSSGGIGYFPHAVDVLAEIVRPVSCEKHRV